MTDENTISDADMKVAKSLWGEGKKEEALSILGIHIPADNSAREPQKRSSAVQKIFYKKLKVVEADEACAAMLKVGEERIDYKCNYSVATVAGVNIHYATELMCAVDKRGNSAQWIEPWGGRPITAIISYPLSKKASIKISPYYRKSPKSDLETQLATQCHFLEVGYVLRQCARAYRMIYKEDARWGIWGHSIGDLFFEGIHYYPRINRVELLMGS